MDIKSLVLLVTVNIAIFSQVGCGGGSGDSEGGDDSITTGDSVNDGITGKLFMGSSGEGTLLDFLTGQYSEIPGVDWSEAIDSDYHPSASYYAMPSKDGAEFIVTIKDCLSGDDPLSPYSDCIILHDSDGQIISSGKMVENISPTTRLSVNKEYFAFFYNDGSDSTTNDELVIFDRNFQFISRSDLGGKLARSFDWLSNGQIVYIHDQTVYVTAPYSTEGSPIYTFTNEEGRPDYIAASPDGNKIAFTLVTDAYTRVIHGATWVMNIDGTDLHQLVYDVNTNDPIINYPSWSPDGRYIINMVGYVAGDGPGTEGVLGGLYAIPSASRNIKLNNDGDNGIIRIRSYYYDTELNYKFSTKGNIVWIP